VPGASAACMAKDGTKEQLIRLFRKYDTTAKRTFPGEIYYEIFRLALPDVPRQDVQLAIEAVRSCDGAEVEYEALLEWIYGLPKRTGSTCTLAADVVNNLEDVGAFVADALVDTCWKGVDRRRIWVQSCSGAGGSQTFKVTAESCEPPSVAFKVDCIEDAPEDPLSDGRRDAAVGALMAAGLYPQRLASGSDWFIEPWAGCNLGSYLCLNEEIPRPPTERPPRCSTPGCTFTTYSELFMIGQAGGCYCCLGCKRTQGRSHSQGVSPITQPRPAMREVSNDPHAQTLYLRPKCQRRPYDQSALPEWGSTHMNQGAATVEEVAVLLAGIHQVSIQWFDEWREMHCESVPSLRAAAPGSHVWAFTYQNTLLGKLSEAGIRRWIKEDLFMPTSRAFSRVVTCHLDFHPANMTRSAAGLQAIDLDRTSVSCAVQDIAWPCSLWLNGCGEAAFDRRRRFIEAYLQAIGEDSDPESVETCLLDGEIARLGTRRSPLWELLPREAEKENEQEVLAHYEAQSSLYRTVVGELRASRALRSKVLRDDLVVYAKQRVAALMTCRDASCTVSSGASAPSGPTSGGLGIELCGQPIPASGFAP